MNPEIRGKNAMDYDQIKTEKEQTLFRLFGLLSWGLYLLLLSITVDVENLNKVVNVSLTYLVLAVLLGFFVDHSIFVTTVRRCAGIFLDVTLTTTLMYLVGSYAAPLFSIYMWVIVGNGFRYGDKYMIFSVLLSLAAFLLLSRVHPFWLQSEEFVFTGVMLLIFVTGIVI